MTVTVCLESDVSNAGRTDSLARSVNYSTVAKHVQEIVEQHGPHKSASTLAGSLAASCLDQFGLEVITVRLEVPRAVLHAVSAGVEVRRHRSRPVNDAVVPDCYFLNDLKVSTIIGVNPWEREEKQNVAISVEALAEPSIDSEEHHTAARFRRIEKLIVDKVSSSTYHTIEALVESIADICLRNLDINRIRVRVEKPSALPFASAAAVEIVRDRDVSALSPKARDLALDQLAPGEHIAYLGLGSNLGQRLGLIQRALSLLSVRGCRILDTSFLYETVAMYVEDQPKFLNIAVKVATAMNPQQLLACAKGIEADLGRTPTVPKGPRNIDVDILFYDNLDIKTDSLTVPHPLIQERDFVLRPLCDVARDFEHPTLYTTCGWLLRLIPHTVKEAGVTRVIPVGKQLWSEAGGPRVMGILNVTPDSFSDGGTYANIEEVVARAFQMVEEGATILDIGGMSTRPNAEDITEQEELDRILPVVRELRRRGFPLPISIDTYRSGVARQAIEAGADMINDVSAGDLDPAMLPLAAELQVPICLMHMRGTPQTMQQLTDYEGDDVLSGVRRELADKVQRALAAGIPRWNIILDPGLGFAKTADQNVTLLRDLGNLCSKGSALEGFPLLVGPSRKGFVGKLQNEPDPKKRVLGTAAACYAALAGGAQILRVHDVKEIADLLRVAKHLVSR